MAKKQSTAALEDLKPVVEALLFAADEPLSTKQLRVLIEGEKKTKKKKAAPVAEVVGEVPAGQPVEAAAPPADEPETLGTTGELAPTESEEEKGGLDSRAFRTIVDSLNADYEAGGRAFLIVEIAGGFQFATRKEYGLYVGRLAKDKSRRRLSQASLETLAIVAYRQPISKPDIEAIRGVNCDEVLSSLMERSLITITGRAESVGRPLLYGTTDDFLKYFGLVSLKDLPRPREIDEMMEARGLLTDQMTLELSAEENVAQIEDQLAHHHSPEAPPTLAEAAAAMGIIEEILPDEKPEADADYNGAVPPEEELLPGSPAGEIDIPVSLDADSGATEDGDSDVVEDLGDDDELDEEEIDEFDLIDEDEEEDEDDDDDDDADEDNHEAPRA